jgi:protein TonB
VPRTADLPLSVDIAPEPTATFARISSPVDPTYYPASRLDVRPKALRVIAPEFPPDAEAANVPGKVIVLLLIDETGKVDQALVVEAIPRDYFEESALTALRSARFEPGPKGNRPVRSRVLISINYDPAGAFRAAHQ